MSGIPDPTDPRARVAVVPTGTANLASVLAGLRRAGADPFPCADPALLRRVERAVVPGVGSFAAGMRVLERHELAGVLRERVDAGRATLFICLGMQLLFEASEESPGVAGLGCFPGRVTRFPGSVRVPQLGWNAITAGAGCRLLRSGYACFANSYRLEAPPPGVASAMAEHGAPFVAAFERGDLLACQFHPELSSDFGGALLRAWIAGAREGVPC